MTNEAEFRTSFGNTLIVGAGPAGIHVGVDVANSWCDQLGLANRPGVHTDKIKRELIATDMRIETEVQIDLYKHLSGVAKLSHFYEGFDVIEDIWDTIILCTPSDSYMNLIDELQIESLTRVKRILLISPGLGSNLLVQSRLGAAGERIEVISFSTYYAATRFDVEADRVLKSLVKGYKRKVYIASSDRNSAFIQEVQRFVEGMGIKCGVSGHPIEAESRGITTYVHPPFFINDFSLSEIFSEVPSKKSMYKLYPEGPITQHAIREMLQLWQEVSEFVRYFDSEPINLLQFLNDDNYPVHEITLSRDDIENFTRFEPIKQQFLLYVRYSSILIDPFSEPDENGKYFDFSAFPYKQVHQDQSGKWVIPRVPYEDYKRLKLLHGLAEKVNVSMPQTALFIERFESKLNEFVHEKGAHLFHQHQLIDSTSDEVATIMAEWEKCK